MKSYSPYFETLYDETGPVADLGRGTHYSVFRTLAWRSPKGELLQRARNHDFAIIWDEDHDERIIPCVEELCFRGDISKFILLGERKAALTAISSKESLEAVGYEKLKEIVIEVAELAPESDTWLGEAQGIQHAHDMIFDSVDRVDAYLRNIVMLWQLGSKIIPELE